MRCKKQAQLQGQKIIPRTCPVCRLGPCTQMDPISEFDDVLIDKMISFRAREIARAVDEGSDITLREWQNMSVPDFLERYRVESKEKSE